MSEVLRLAPEQDKRLRAGHLWVYSNEVDNERTPLRAFDVGQPVEIENAAGKWLGRGYINPNSLICARVMTRNSASNIDVSLLVHRINVALAMRERAHAKPYYRLLFGEADGVPGAVVDRFADYLVVQITTAGMEALREPLLEALLKVMKPKGILLRNDTASRELEGLTRYIETAYGELPDRVTVEEGECRFEMSPIEGQKTGWFYDQAANRDLLMPYVKGARVLDVCSYVGAWSIRAAHSGASQILAVDSSASALELVQHNAAQNQVKERVSVLRADAFDALRDLRAQRERFDVVVLDPPAFVKRKKDLKQGALAYRRLNEAALGLVERDGLLVTASCSFHMHGDQLLRTVQQAARHSDRSLQLLHQGHQSPDHPIHPAILETAYLKAFYLRVLPTQ